MPLRLRKKHREFIVMRCICILNDGMSAYSFQVGICAR
jgi:hypothetical protein